MSVLCFVHVDCLFCFCLVDCCLSVCVWLVVYQLARLFLFVILPLFSLIFGCVFVFICRVCVYVRVRAHVFFVFMCSGCFVCCICVVWSSFCLFVVCLCFGFVLCVVCCVYVRSVLS